MLLRKRSGFIQKGALAFIIIFFSVVFEGYGLKKESKDRILREYYQIRFSKKFSSGKVFLLGKKAYLLGYYRVALWCFQELEKRGVRRKKLFLWLAKSYISLGRYEEAIRVLRKEKRGRERDLLLLYAYYKKAGGKKDKNVVYLWKRFRSLYGFYGRYRWLKDF